MKITLNILSVIFMTLFLAACNVNDPFVFFDTQPPAPPTGIVVMNGDNRVDLSWLKNREGDVAGYNIYSSNSYDGKYTLIGSSENNYFVDLDVSNGNTYYYAVTAYDLNGNESDLSYDVIYTTPRPEGFNQSIFNYRKFPDNSGYSFSTYSVIAYDDSTTDLFFENYNGNFYLDVWDDTDIQDMGQTVDIYDVSTAPLNGWSKTKDAVAKVGHTYVIWTWDNHFAKVRINSITNDRITFDWAYQLVEGNDLLKAKRPNKNRKPLNKLRMRQ
ncbi:MAG TPA: hypothetical protein ENI57_00915 [Ignavibacteria bacterium]|nr:hypothetical protein [Ignavibacteria bacterium]